GTRVARAAKRTRGIGCNGAPPAHGLRLVCRRPGRAHRRRLEHRRHSSDALRRRLPASATTCGAIGPVVNRLVYSTTAIISISTIASGGARPPIWIVVLVGLATPK